MRYLFVDFETTGLLPQENEVTEVAALLTDENGAEITRFQTLCTIAGDVPQFITDLTGIKAEMLERGMYTSKWTAILAMLIEDTVLVAHNAPFELGFLHAYGVIEEKKRQPFICTRTLAHIENPGVSSSLKPVCERKGIELEGHHRAMNDVMATRNLFFKLREEGMLVRSYVNTIFNDPRGFTYLPPHAVFLKDH